MREAKVLTANSFKPLVADPRLSIYEAPKLTLAQALTLLFVGTLCHGVSSERGLRRGLEAGD